MYDPSFNQVVVGSIPTGLTRFSSLTDVGALVCRSVRLQPLARQLLRLGNLSGCHLALEKMPGLHRVVVVFAGRARGEKPGGWLDGSHRPGHVPRGADRRWRLSGGEA